MSTHITCVLKDVRVALTYSKPVFSIRFPGPVDNRTALVVHVHEVDNVISNQLQWHTRAVCSGCLSTSSSQENLSFTDQRDKNFVN